MQRSIRLPLSLGGAGALAIASTPLLPAAAQDADTADDLSGVMSISLKDVVKPTIGFQGALQAQAPPTKLASAVYCHCRLVRTAFGISMPSSMSTLLTAMARAASSTPMWMVASPLPHAWATAG